MCGPCLPPPVSISTVQQRMYVLIFVEVGRGVCGHRGACCTSTTMFFGGAVVYFICFYVGETCGTVCGPRLPPPVSISTAQQRVYLFVFVEVEWSACGHRGACCASTTMFLGGQLCNFFAFMWESGLWHHVWPMPASSRLHIDSAAAYVCAYICRGGVGRV